MKGAHGQTLNSTEDSVETERFCLAQGRMLVVSRLATSWLFEKTAFPNMLCLLNSRKEGGLSGGPFWEACQCLP